MLNDAETLALLAWYVAIGADEPVAEAPVDRLTGRREDPSPAPPAALTEPPAALTEPPVRASVADRGAPSEAVGPPPTALGAGEGLAEAQALAAAAGDLSALDAAVRGFRGVGLARTAANAVVGSTAAFAGHAVDLLVVGSQPDDAGDLAGEPLVGPAGQLFDRMLAAIGRGRGDQPVTMATPWRPPGGRRPTDAELAIAATFLARRLALLRPGRILALGDTAARLLTGLSRPAARLRGKRHALSERLTDDPAAVEVLVSFDPGILIATPTMKRHAWNDMLQLQVWLEGGGFPPQSGR